MIFRRKIGPYSSAHVLNFSHECCSGMSRRLPIIGFPTRKRDCVNLGSALEFLGGCRSACGGSIRDRWQSTYQVALAAASHPSALFAFLQSLFGHRHQPGGRRLQRSQAAMPYYRSADAPQQQVAKGEHPKITSFTEIPHSYPSCRVGRQ